MIVLFSGLVAGALHVVSGPDHLAAVAPLSVDGRGRAWRTGLRWGLGHAASVGALALLGFAVREELDLDAISGASERVVGALLIGIGLWGLRRALVGRLHDHRHAHAELEHAHVHAHAPGVDAGPRTHAHRHAAFAIGSLHGLAGSAHFLGVIPALALPSASQSALYVAGFLAGTLLAMIAFSSALGFWSARTRSPAGVRRLLAGCSAASIVVGVAWLAA